MRHHCCRCLSRFQTCSRGEMTLCPMTVYVSHVMIIACVIMIVYRSASSRCFCMTFRVLLFPICCILLTTSSPSIPSLHLFHFHFLLLPLLFFYAFSSFLPSLWLIFLDSNTFFLTSACLCTCSFDIVCGCVALADLVGTCKYCEGAK